MFFIYSSVEEPQQPAESSTSVYIATPGGHPPAPPQTPAPTEPTTAPSTTTGSTTTRRTYTYTPFICTVTEDAKPSFRYPPDGLCELIYFQMTYHYDRHHFKDPLTEPIRLFAEHAKQHTNRTRFGIGISLLNITVAQDEFAEKGDVGKRVRDRLDYFADHKTNSYGVVDMECMAYALDQAYVVNVFNIFNAFVGYHKLKGHRLGINMMASMYSNSAISAEWDRDKSYKIYNMFRPNNTPSPENVHRFVYLTHVPYSEMLEGRDCVIQTPQVLFRLNTTYQYHREPTSILAASVYNRIVEYVPYMDRYNRLISITLRLVNKVPWDKDKNVPAIGNFGWNKRCDAHGDITDNRYRRPNLTGWIPWTTYSEICNDPVYSRNLDCAPKGLDEGCITYNKQKELSIVWDDAVSLRRKICVARTNLTYLFSFAVYAIDYDDSDYACPRLSPYGPYSRLRMLYQLRNYLSRHYLNESDEPGCHKVQPKFITPEDFWKIESWPNEGV
ncbi:uncharacterized protein LOC144100154 [Amblyomma americanum]